MNAPTCEALFLADNPALDFINSAYGTGAQQHDCFTDDRSVMDWLGMAGLVATGTEGDVPPGLLASAQALRGHLRAAVTAAMNGEVPDLSVINQQLEAGRPLRKLEWDEQAQRVHTGLHPRDNSPATLLWPVVDALAQLLIDEKFQFVRQCEAHDCILLFHDLSKSHRRRWCSMSTCGNRMKAATFRSRKKAE